MLIHTSDSSFTDGRIKTYTKCAQGRARALNDPDASTYRSQRPGALGPDPTRLCGTLARKFPALAPVSGVYGLTKAVTHVTNGLHT